MRDKIERYFYLFLAVLTVCLTFIGWAIALSFCSRADAAPPPPVLTVSAIIDSTLVDKTDEETIRTWVDFTLRATRDIYWEQVRIDMQIVNTQVEHVSDDTQPEFLLMNVAKVRSLDPAMYVTGVTIFFTDRDMSIGAYHYQGYALRGPPYSPQAVAVVRLSSRSDVDPYVTAHEIAHVFGVPHDGEKYCANEAPTGHIMQAVGIGGMTFSDCSLKVFSMAILSTPGLTAPPQPLQSPPPPVKKSGAFDGTTLLVLLIFYGVWFCYHNLWRK